MGVKGRSLVNAPDVHFKFSDQGTIIEMDKFLQEHVQVEFKIPMVRSPVKSVDEMQLSFQVIRPHGVSYWCRYNIHPFTIARLFSQ